MVLNKIRHHPQLFRIFAMDRLTSMQAFTQVAELSSFAAAARKLGMSPAMVTKHIAHLERLLNVTLLTRSTRKVSLTEAGAKYLNHCIEVLRLVAAASDQIAHQTDTPSGTLRVTAPVELGNRHIAPLIPQLITAHPQLCIQLDFSNRVVDLIEEGMDVAVRVAAKLDTALSGRQLASSRLVPVAAPSYLAQRGTPKKPEDLISHDALVFGVGDWAAWKYTNSRQAGTIAVAPRMHSTSSEALRVAALEGAGISLLPTFLVGDDLCAGRLQPLLTRWNFGALGIHALYPQRRYHPARLRAFIDLLVAHFGGDPRCDPFWTAT